MAEREALLDYLWDLTLLKRINFLRNLFFLIFISPFVNFFGQEIGDSIIFNTYNGKVYKGVLEKKDQDGYFFKSSYNRIIYLSKTEIKEFQKIKKEILKAESTISAINEIPTKINTEQKIVIEEKISLIIPASDEEALKVSKHYDFFKSNKTDPKKRLKKSLKLHEITEKSYDRKTRNFQFFRKN